MVSARPLVTVARVPITIGIIVTFTFDSFFHSIARSKCLSFFSPFLLTLFCGQPRQQNTQLSEFSLFLLLLLIITKSGRNLEIRLYLSIQGEFVRLILQDRFWIVHIPFVRVVKFKFLAQFPGDHHAYQIVSIIIIIIIITFEIRDIHSNLNFVTLPRESFFGFVTRSTASTHAQQSVLSSLNEIILLYRKY